MDAKVQHVVEHGTQGLGMTGSDMEYGQLDRSSITHAHIMLVPICPSWNTAEHFTVRGEQR